MVDQTVPVPERGSLIWLDFSPQAGREQAGRRPGLVVSPGAYNERVGLALVCPITSRRKGYPFEVSLPPGLPVQGVVLADHLRSVDWRERRLDLLGQVPEDVLEQVIQRVEALLRPT